MNPKNEIFFLEPEQADSFELKGIAIDQLLPRRACDHFSAYLVRMKPGQVKKVSYHKVGEELYFVVSGGGKAVLGEQEFTLRPGCFFRVPPNTLHQFTTEAEPLELLNFHSPPVFSDHDTYFPE